jgi:translation initiation factor 5A
MATKLTNAGAIKEGSYMLIDGVACKVADSVHGKGGKHGAAKMRIVAIGLLDGKRREVVMPASDNVEVPIIEKKSAQVLSVSGDNASVMDTESYETFDLAIPEELKGKVVEGVQVLYWVITEQKVMKQLKSGTEE